MAPAPLQPGLFRNMAALQGLGWLKGFLRLSSQKETDMHIQQMIATHPEVKGHTAGRLLRCIEECHDCAAVCTSCADACLAEPMVEQLRQCIRLNLDCADICATAGAIASRRTGSNIEVIRAVIDACGTACRACGEECRRHAGMHEHCRICAESCMRCAEACRDALGDLH